MSHLEAIPAQRKNLTGTGAARAVRRAGQLPGVVYGGHAGPVMVAVDPRHILKGLNKPGFFATIFDLDLGDAKEKVLPKAIQFHPVTDALLHIDFQRVTESTMVTLTVPVHLINQDKCRGLKTGGVLNIARQSVKITCPANAIPDSFEIDIANLKVGESVKTSALDLPAGVQLAGKETLYTIATIAKPRGGAVGGDEEEAAA